MAHKRIIYPGTGPQLDFWSSETKFRAFVGGVGSGKTRAGCVEVLKQPKSSRGVVVAPTYGMLRDATLASFMDLARPLGLIPPSGHNDSKMITRLTTGIEILWRSADDPDHLRGPNLGWFWLDEGGQLNSGETWDILIGRLRLPPGRGWVTTTPSGFNWLYKLFVQDKRDDYKLVRTSTRDNNFLPREYIKSLEEKYEGAWAKQEIEGEFAEWVDSPCYTGFSRSVNLEPKVLDRYRPDLPLVVCCDFNVRFMSWPVVQTIKGQPWVLTEITSSPADIDGQVQAFRNQFPAHQAGMIVYGDAAGNGRTAQTGQSDYDLMRLALRGYPCGVEYRVPASNPPVRDRIAAVNRLLKGADRMYPLKIDRDRCPELIEDLVRVQWNKAGTGEEQIQDPSDDRSRRTHSAAGLGYFAHREYPVHRDLFKPKVQQPIVVRPERLLGAI